MRPTRGATSTKRKWPAGVAGELLSTLRALKRRQSILVLLLRDILEIYRAYNFRTQVLAASLRHPIHVIEAARLGADIGTMPYKVLEQLLKHPLTDKGQDQFLADWKKRAAKA